MNRFFEEHPTLASALGVILFLVSIAVLSLLAGCKPQQHIVEIVKTDTLHVYHTDTLKVVHNDTIFSFKVETKHDSIIIKEKYYLDADGNVTLTEKEKESYRESDTDSQLIRHTIDSLARVWMDSVYHARYEDKPVIVEVEKESPWYQKCWNWIQSKSAYLAIAIIIIAFSDYLFRSFLSFFKNKSQKK